MEEDVEQSKRKYSLALKDFVNIGIFSVIYFVMMFAVGTPLGFLVVTYLAFPCIASIILGIPSMFLLAKTPKPFALFIFAAFPGTLMTIMGHTSIVMLHALIIATLAELIRKLFGYKTIKGSIAGYAVMSTHFAGAFWQIYIFNAQYRALTESMMGKDYAEQLLSLPIWIMPMLYVTAILGGVIGGFLGTKLLKKHFLKAGLI